MESATVLQTEKTAEDGVFVRALKEREANRQNAVLVKKRPGSETYVSILRAIKMGANHPSLIVTSTKISWITVMQCVRTLEQKGFIQTGYDPASSQVISKLTDAGSQVLDQ